MNETVAKLMNAYDSVPYNSCAHRNAHPDRLAVVAQIGGLSPQNVENCRVLEIGCAEGGNLLPMAEQLPQNSFLGIDLSPRQIEAGSEVIRQLALTNVQMRCLDLMEFPQDAGQFDFIIAHGVYSWVPQPVRQRLFEICRDHLAPHGVAYISFNAYPGWRQKQIARDMMLYRARRASDPRERAALGRQIVQIVAAHTPQAGFPKEILQFLQNSIAAVPDETILHDYMEVVNEPQYFWRFMEEAAANGLSYVGEANDDPDPWFILPNPVRQTILKISENALDREQYLDYLVGRSFRGTVLGLSQSAAGAASSPIGRFRKLFVAGNLTETHSGTDRDGRAISQFGSGAHRLLVIDPAWFAVLRHITRAWPSAVPFADLLAIFAGHRPPTAAQETIAQELERVIETCHGVRLVELWTRPTSFLAPASVDYPRVTRYARWQAAHGLSVTSLRHTPVALDQTWQSFIPLLDGSKNRQALELELARQHGPSASPQQIKLLIQSALSMLAKSSLLVTAPAAATK